MNRRRLLKDSLGLAAASACLLAAAPFATGAAPDSLKERAARKGIVFGSEVLYSELHDDPDYAALVARECAMITPGWEAKWDHSEPSPGHFDFAELDWLADFAARNGIALHMHTLVWGVAMPEWLKLQLPLGGGEAALRRHIGTEVGRYRGKVEAWDVVNEILDPRWSRGPEGLTRTPWRKAMGPDYVETAFRLAAEADGKAKLFMNDDDLEYDEPDRQEKRDAYLRLIDGWLRRGVPIHGFGLQAHLKPERRIAEKAYADFLSRLAGFGLTIYVTELDVQDAPLPADPERRDRAVADYCRRYLDLVLDQPAVKAVLTWGLSDRYTYQNSDPETKRSDGLPSRGLPYDRELRSKPMWRAIAEALDHARQRP
ncbi:MAG: endo-1,4-beta-xylanase [Alphaproteobacteria bacterium]|nr:endo-1,4-beta-xylanase [Hyphomicrobiales bacterium]MBV8651146.1 endo-1,4-beta-xylanase [Alphaproteobacteria bacterium]